MPHEIGDLVRLDTEFRVGGTLTDPTDVVLVVRDPAGTSTTYDYSPGTVVRDSVGVFHQDITVSLAGVYFWKWTGTGTASGVDEGSFTVEETLLGDNVLCSVDDVKQGIESSVTVDDDLIQSHIVAASEAIAQRCQREFLGPTGGTRTFSIGRTGYLVDLAPFDLRSGGTLTLHPEETSQALTLGSDYMLKPEGGARLGGTYQQVRLSGRLVLNSTLYREFGEARLRIIGNWGCFTGGAIDPAIRRSCVLTVGSWLQRRREGGIFVDEVREIRPEFTTDYAIPSSAYTLLTPWLRMGNY